MDNGFWNDTSPELETCRPSIWFVPRVKDQPFVCSQKVSSATPYTVHGAWTIALEGAARQAAALVAAETRATPAAYWPGVREPEAFKAFKGSRGSRGSRGSSGTADVTAAGTGSGAPEGATGLVTA
ncbi:MAG: hypothetical protein BWZ02_03100 [Lentisphaerae bacterium ADurb.BinA184]|nr:MAG: hypothetical protein BWZ02_03100 [Lentisphaerae bacterium ADurb.BinA184]